MILDLKLFARARDIAGNDSVQIDVPDDANVADLRQELGQQFPQLQGLLPNLLFAVGTDYADDATLIAPDTEVACFPPVSGG